MRFSLNLFRARLRSTRLCAGVMVLPPPLSIGMQEHQLRKQFFVGCSSQFMRHGIRVAALRVWCNQCHTTPARSVETRRHPAPAILGVWGQQSYDGCHACPLPPPIRKPRLVKMEGTMSNSKHRAPEKLVLGAGRLGYPLKLGRRGESCAVSQLPILAQILCVFAGHLQQYWARQGIACLPPQSGIPAKRSLGSNLGLNAVRR